MFKRTRCFQANHVLVRGLCVGTASELLIDILVLLKTNVAECNMQHANRDTEFDVSLRLFNFDDNVDVDVNVNNDLDDVS